MLPSLLSFLVTELQVLNPWKVRETPISTPAMGSGCRTRCVEQKRRYLIPDIVTTPCKMAENLLNQMYKWKNVVPSYDSPPNVDVASSQTDDF